MTYWPKLMLHLIIDEDSVLVRVFLNDDISMTRTELYHGVMRLNKRRNMWVAWDTTDPLSDLWHDVQRIIESLMKKSIKQLIFYEINDLPPKNKYPYARPTILCNFCDPVFSFGWSY